MAKHEIYPREGAMFDPPTPGEILRNDYLDPLNLTISELAKRMCVHRHTVMRVINGDTRLSIDFARRLARVFGTSTGIWLRLQQARDEWEASRMPDSDLAEVKPLNWSPSQPQA